MKIDRHFFVAITSMLSSFLMSFPTSAQESYISCYKDDFFGCETCVETILGDGQNYRYTIKDGRQCLSEQSRKLMSALGTTQWNHTGFSSTDLSTDMRPPPPKFLNQFSGYEGILFESLESFADFQERVDTLNNNANAVVNRFKSVLQQNTKLLEQRNSRLNGSVGDLNVEIQNQYEEISKLNDLSILGLEADVTSLRDELQSVSLDELVIARNLTDQFWNEPGKPFSFRGPEGELREENERLYRLLKGQRPRTTETRVAKSLGMSAIEVSDAFDQEGDTESAEMATEIGKELLDFVLGVAPGVSVVKDAYELFTGYNVVTGKKLTEFDQVAAGIGLITLGGSKWITKGVKVVGRLGRAVSVSAIRYSVKGSKKAITSAANIVTAAHDLNIRHRVNITQLGNMAGRVSQVDTDTYSNIGKIVDSAKNISPKLGNKYVKDLPNLSLEGEVAAFLGPIHKGIYEPGEILFRAQDSGAHKIGRWFTPIKPINAAHAKELLELGVSGNNAGRVLVFKVKERVSGYAGKIAGGNSTGHQFFIPRDVPIEDVVEEIVF